METIFFDGDFIGSGGEIKLIICDRGELVIDHDSSRLGVGGDVEKACPGERAFGEVWAIPFGELDSYKSAPSEKKDDQKIDEETSKFGVFGCMDHRYIIARSRC